MNLSIDLDIPGTTALSDLAHGKKAGVLSDGAYTWFQYIFQPFSLFLAVVGVITNIINIRVFVEQGVKNSNTNIGLLALSIFDLLASLLMVVPLSCYIFTHTKDLSRFIYCQTYSNYAIFVAFICGYCSNWTTVYISLERTLCVVIPLKVKLFFRPKVTVLAIVCIYIFFFVVQMTYTTSTRIRWRFYPSLNTSLPFFDEMPFAKKYLTIYSTLANTVLNSLAILIVATNTAIMVYKLNQFTKWRSKTTSSASSVQNHQNTTAAATSSSSSSSSSSSTMSSKDAELVKSVTTVTCIFLVCVSMSHIPATVILVLPGVTFTGINRNLMFLAYTVRSTFGLVNSSTNFFFYLTVSTRYKEAFSRVFSSRTAGADVDKQTS